MKAPFSIVYSSKTGNTAVLAKKIQSCLPGGDAVYCGPPACDAADADFIFAGFWTNMGTCDEGMSAFLEGLRGKKLFLFGTAGFGGEPEYFAKILSRVSSKLDGSNWVVGSFLCQGKMPDSVQKKYEALASQEPSKAAVLLENFERALQHPDASDLERLEQAVLEAVNGEND